jgi:uncharacterized RmlC-like cupin family protein
MMETARWRDAVRIVRGNSLDMTMRDPSTSGRATAFDFSGVGGRETWIGTVKLRPNGSTGAHHHGRHEVAVYVVSGCSEIRWGEGLEYVANVGPGDFVYFAPYVPHQERNSSAREPVDFLVIRSENVVA